MNCFENSKQGLTPQIRLMTPQIRLTPQIRPTDPHRSGSTSETLLARDTWDCAKDSLAFSSGSPNSAMLAEWKNGTPIPKRRVFCSEDCGTTTPRVNLG